MNRVIDSIQTDDMKPLATDDGWDAYRREFHDHTVRIEQHQAQLTEIKAQLNDAIRAREIAQRDLRKLQRRTADLEADNARLQAQTGDGR